MPAYSNNHPDGRHTIKTGYAIECDIMEDDHSSGPRLIQPVDITDDLKNVINDTCDYDRSKDDQGKPEIRFGYDNFSVGYDKNNDVVYKYNELTKIEFQINLLPKGVGLHSICQSESDEPSEYDDDMFRSNDNSVDDQDDDSDNCEKSGIWD